MTLRFSSGDIPVAQRNEAVAAAFGLHVNGTVDFPGETAPAVGLALRAVAGVHIAAIELSPIVLTSPPDDNGAVYLGITSAGGGLMTAASEGREVRTGDITVIRRDRTCTIVAAEPSTILSLAISRSELLPRLADPDRIHAPTIEATSAARLLQTYATALLREDGDIAPDLQATFASHLVDLAALTLGAGRDGREQARTGGLKAARRRAVKADIAAHLDRPELSLAWLGRRHGLSPAYLRALFYDEGTSFTDYVLNQRLDHVRTLLASAYLAHQTIATLALMAGFNDVSWFNQAFRRRFGLTPSDVRKGTGPNGDRGPTA